MSSKFHVRYDEETKRRAITQVLNGGVSQAQTAREFGVSRSTLQGWLSDYERPDGRDVGQPADPVGVPIDRRNVDGTVSIVEQDRPRKLPELMDLFGIDQSLWVPTYLRSNEWEGFYKLSDGDDHRKVKLWQTRASFKRILGEEQQSRLAEWCRKNMRPLSKNALVKTRKQPKTIPYHVAWGLWDAHLGMHAWHREVNDDADLTQAENRVKNSIDDMIDELAPYNIEAIHMPIGNDFMHFDSVRATTTYGTHYLDTDTRYAKVFVSALECLAYKLERAAEITDQIYVYHVPGNHDLNSSFALCMALEQRFKDDPRFIFDNSPNPLKFAIFGTCILCFNHGQEYKPDQFAQTLGTHPEAKAAWSESTYREVQIGHKHQRWEKMYEGLIPTNGVLVRRNPALCNVDAWHHEKGLIGEPVKSVEAWRYSHFGYAGSHVTWARDEERYPLNPA